MLARRDTRIKASRLRRFSPLQAVEDQSQTWGRCCHFCTGREGLAPSWNTEIQSLALCGLPEDSVLFQPTGHTGRSGSAALSRQLFEQSLRLLKVRRVKALGEPTIDRGQ